MKRSQIADVETDMVISAILVAMSSLLYGSGQAISNQCQAMSSHVVTTQKPLSMYALLCFHSTRPPKEQSFHRCHDQSLTFQLATKCTELQSIGCNHSVSAGCAVPLSATIPHPRAAVNRSRYPGNSVTRVRHTRVRHTTCKS